MFHIAVFIDIALAAFRNFTFITRLFHILDAIWLLPIGVTFFISSIIARSWRVYRLFVHTFHPGRCLTSNRFIFGLILGFIFGDLFLATFTSILIFYVINSTSYHLSLSAIIYILFAIIVIIKIGTFVILFILTFLTEKIDKEHYSTKSYYFVFVFSVLLVVFILYNEFVFHTSYNLVLALLLEITIDIIFVFLPPLLPILKSFKHS